MLGPLARRVGLGYAKPRATLTATIAGEPYVIYPECSVGYRIVEYEELGSATPDHPLTRKPLSAKAVGHGGPGPAPPQGLESVPRDVHTATGSDGIDQNVGLVPPYGGDTNALGRRGSVARDRE